MACVTLPCGHCHGSGQKEAGKLSETLDFLRRQTNWVTSQVVARALEIGETNAVNRLQELHGLGLVERHGRRPYEWRQK